MSRQLEIDRDMSSAMRDNLAATRPRLHLVVVIPAENIRAAIDERSLIEFRSIGE
jgi:hypothetical protein